VKAILSIAAVPVRRRATFSSRVIAIVLPLLLCLAPSIAGQTQGRRPVGTVRIGPLVSTDPPTSAFTSSPSTTLSWSHTVGVVPNRLLIVGVSIATATTSVSSVTYGAQSLSLVGTQNGQGMQNRIELWSLLAPPSGTATVTVTLGLPAVFGGGAASFADVDQTTPLGTFVSAGGNSTTPTVTVSSGPGDVVVDTVAARGDTLTLTPDPSQTQLFNY